MGGWANGQRGVCGGEGDGADAVEHSECARGRGRSRSTGEGCVAVRAMVRMSSSMASALGSEQVEENQRGVCGSEGDGAHAIHKGI